jgi:hypothetical protein
MTPLSPSELVYLHADQFIKPRPSPIGNTATVLSTGRNVNRRLMVIEVLKAAIIANITVELLRIELKPLEAMRDSKARFEQIGLAGRLVAGMIGNLADKPQSHLSRLAAPSPWQAGMLEAQLLDAHDEGVPQPVQDSIVRVFGNTFASDGQVIQMLRQTLESRGVIARRKRFLGETWTLAAGQADATRVRAPAAGSLGATRARRRVWSIALRRLAALR